MQGPAVVIRGCLLASAGKWIKALASTGMHMPVPDTIMAEYSLNRGPYIQAASARSM